MSQSTLYEVSQIGLDSSPMRTHWVDSMAKAEKVAQSWERVIDSLDFDDPESASMVVIEPRTMDSDLVPYFMADTSRAYIA